ncbi:TraB family protein [Kordia sp. SMS9]|uniref:TraB/GumN family protein n=1 Tax=Kordia sp. SMS9 TaxID=2282170 RepID=UPI000E0D5067|nr:TraB/GumN family protein [Kordia sp. SMS9]AXG68349.1 TraB family protein [Kordia sp. SMS9]
MKKIIALCCFIVSSFTINAQDQKLENSVLWKIEHKDLEKPSYLLGTIHILCKDDFAIPAKVTNAFKETENLVLEVDMSDTKALMAAQKKMMSGGKLTEELSKEQQTFLDNLLKKELNMSLQMVNSYTLMTVYTLLIQQSYNCPIKKMYEVELTSLAKANNKKVAGLETLDGQLDFFAKAYPKDFLWQQVKLFSEYKTMMQDMVTSYKNEEIGKLHNDMKDERFFNKNAEYWMLTVRNNNWAKLMPELMKKQSNLFAVGAAHLPGENGVIALLQKQGFTVTPVF